MVAKNNLRRFIDAQDQDYYIALTEIKAACKRSHWMWYIFPQVAGLGFSQMAERYAIEDLSEAVAYLAHPILGYRLIEITNALLQIPGNNATLIVGSPDDLKLRSSMTLFSLVPASDPVFKAVLKKFFDGEKDSATLQLIK